MSRKNEDEPGPVTVSSYGLIEDLERLENSYDDSVFPEEWSDCSMRTDEEPRQLWASLCTKKLDDTTITDPILSALHETWRKARAEKAIQREKQKKENR
jgi:hypothetical protein